MKRQLIVLVVMIAIGLQSSVVAFAATSPVMTTSCETAAISHSDASQKSCCPSGLHTMNCCLDACLTAVGIIVSPAPTMWYGRTARALPFHASTFSSRGDSPLIRPPIL
jgi:hypothetical protein